MRTPRGSFRGILIRGSVLAAGLRDRDAVQRKRARALTDECNRDRARVRFTDLWVFDALRHDGDYSSTE